MIAHLRGTLIERLGGAIILDCGGVGYEVHVSSHTMGELPAMGSDCSLRVFTSAQENRIALFGFSSSEERALFDLLITVKRIGPSSAIKILSAGTGPHDIAQMIASRQTRSLTSLKGVGKKTAEMIIVELHEKCETLLATWGWQLSADASTRVFTPAADPRLADVRSAMVQLGFKNSEVDQVLTTLVITADASSESLLMEALRSVPSNK